MRLPLNSLFYFMPKDPAFLFYVNDFDSGTKFFTDEQVGKYLRLLIAQFQHGALNEKQVLFICREYDEDIMKKFQKDENGNYFNDRLAQEITKRSRFSESRSNNRKGKNKEEVKNMSLTHVDTYVKHMENEDEDENEDERSKSIKCIFVEIFGSLDLYPKWIEWIKYKKTQFKFVYKNGNSEITALKNLNTLSNGKTDIAAAIINQSIGNGWKGFFAIKTSSNEPANRDQARIDYWNHMVDTFGTDEEKVTRKIV
jgi:uncharacterized protein YdaU (DUF1376 family)